MLSICLLYHLLFQTERPVIRLDEITIEGEVRRPQIIEIEAGQLPEMIEKMALKNLLKIEREVLEPLRLESFRMQKSAAK